jgi:hypothetical protein
VSQLIVNINTKLLESALRHVPASPMVEFQINEKELVFKNMQPNLTGFFQVKISNTLFQDWDYTPSEDWDGNSAANFGAVLNVLSVITALTVRMILTKYSVCVYAEGNELLSLSSLNYRVRRIRLPEEFRAILKISDKLLSSKLKILKKISSLIKFEFSDQMVNLSAIAKDKTCKSTFNLLQSPDVEYQSGNLVVKLDSAQHLDSIIPVLKDSRLTLKFTSNILIICYESTSGLTGFLIAATMQ